MLTRVRAGRYTIFGVSVGGVYTALSVPELDSIFDIGIAPRSFVGAKHLFVSHGHADHVGSFVSMLGVRGLSRVDAPRTFLPRELRADLEESIDALNRAQRRGLVVPFVPMDPGSVEPLYGDLHARAFRTLHTIPSLGYELVRRVPKLRSEYVALPAAEIRLRRERGDDLFEEHERSEFAYATDTLIDVLDAEPRLYRTRTLVLECTFLDDRKGRRECREKGHIHVDEIAERAHLFENEALVLMHFSQLYQPGEVRRLLAARLPETLLERVVVFAPVSGPWPG